MSNENERLRRQLRDCLATCRVETAKLRAAKIAAIAEAARLRKELETPLRDRYRKFATKRLKEDRALLRRRIAMAERTMLAFNEKAWGALMQCTHPDGNPSKETKTRAFQELMMRERPAERAAIKEDIARLEHVERLLAAEEERGKRIPVAMPRELLDVMKNIAGYAPLLTVAERAELHRRLSRLLMAGYVNEGWADYGSGHISYRVLDMLAPSELLDLRDLPAVGSA